jgi:hypothetical protein
VHIANPLSWVKLFTRPRTVALSESSPEMKKATIGICSVTNRWRSKPASSGEIMRELMTREFGVEQAERWCKRLDFI